MKTLADKAVIEHSGTHVVPVDAIVLLTGVNFGSVRKVLAGIRALQRFTGVDPGVLIDWENIPERRIYPEDPRDQDRADATRDLCVDLIALSDVSDIEEILHLDERFGVPEVSGGNETWRLPRG